MIILELSLLDLDACLHDHENTINLEDEKWLNLEGNIGKFWKYRSPVCFY